MYDTGHDSSLQQSGVSSWLFYKSYNHCASGILTFHSFLVKIPPPSAADLNLPSFSLTVPSMFCSVCKQTHIHLEPPVLMLLEQCLSVHYVLLKIYKNNSKYHNTVFLISFLVLSRSQHFGHISAIGPPNWFSWITTSNQYLPISPWLTDYLSHMIFESAVRDKWP